MAMKIAGSGKTAVSMDVVENLIEARQSGKAISQKEAKKAIAKASDLLRLEFDPAGGGAWRDGKTTGLTGMQRSIANAFKLALSSGWVKGVKAQEMIESYIKGGDEGSLADLAKEIRAAARRRRPDPQLYNSPAVIDRIPNSWTS